MNEAEKAKLMTDSIIQLLKGRKGFDSWWGDIDYEDQRDIHVQIEEIILRLS
jgi:hypothetical protein